MATKHITQADVARLARVSRSTVSLVLNPSAASRVPISEETRIRVHSAVQELGYVPNPVAQMLAGGRNNLIGVFVYGREFPVEQQDFFYYYLLGIERGARAANHNLVLYTGSPTPGNRQVYNNGQNCLELASGAILLGAEPDRAELCQLTAEGYPFVFVGRREVSGCQVDWVSSDYKTSSCEAFLHLASLGHRRVGLIGLRMDLESNRDRLAGCQSAIAATSGADLAVLDHPDPEQPTPFARAILEQGITALLCHDQKDLNTIVPALTAAGLRVPEDVSVIWMSPADRPDNMPANPTRVHFDRAAVGEAAVRMLVARLKGEVTAPQQVLMPCTFIAGDTTAPPRLHNAQRAPNL